MTMQVLGINFGHDASLALFKDGSLVSFRELERHSRLKHQVGIAAFEVKQFLSDAETTLEEVDYSAITATQFYTARFDENISLQVLDQSHLIHAQYTSNWYDYAEHKQRLTNPRESILPDKVFDADVLFRTEKELKAHVKIT